MLVPGSSTLSVPLQFRRSQDFYIVSIISVNCNSSLSMVTQWAIKNCSAFSCSHRISPDPTIITTLSELYVPGRSLPYGLYELELTVTMAQIPSLSSSLSVYVRINPSGISANLIQYGTSMITQGDQQDLQFNPGSYSLDPDDDDFNASVSVREQHRPFYLFTSSPRTGSTSIIVASTDCTCFRIWGVHYCQWMILGTIP
jgi:hypothetical protein